MLIGGWSHRDPQVRIELRPCRDSINIFAIVFYVLDSLKSSESKEFVKFVLIKTKIESLCYRRSYFCFVLISFRIIVFVKMFIGNGPGCRM